MRAGSSPSDAGSERGSTSAPPVRAVDVVMGSIIPWLPPSFHVLQRLEQALRVTQREGMLALAIRVGLGDGDVVGAEHPLVAGIPVHLQHLEEVDVAVVGVDLFEVQVATLDVAEVDHEDALVLDEKLDRLGHLPGGVLAHFGQRALAEIEAIDRAIELAYPALHALDRAEDRVDTAQPLTPRERGVVRVDGELDVRLLGGRDDLVEHVEGVVPELLLGHSAERGQRVVGPLLDVEMAVGGAAAAGCPAGAEDADDVAVVLEAWHAGLAG